MVRDTPPSQDASTHQIWNSSLKEFDLKIVWDTLSSQDVFTHQSWNSYLKEYRRYAPDSMQFLDTRSEIKFKITVTQLWYATLRQSKMHPHTIFEIPTSNNIRDMLWT